MKPHYESPDDDGAVVAYPKKNFMQWIRTVLFKHSIPKGKMLDGIDAITEIDSTYDRYAYQRVLNLSDHLLKTLKLKKEKNNAKK